MVILIGGLFGYQYYNNNQTVTRVEFNKAHEILNRKIDSLDLICRRVDANVLELKNNVDTLKKGQVIIYNEVRKNSERNFWDFIK